MNGVHINEVDLLFHSLREGLEGRKQEITFAGQFFERMSHTKNVQEYGRMHTYVYAHAWLYVRIRMFAFFLH